MTEFNDLGLDRVAEFQRTFGAHMGEKPEVPNYDPPAAAMLAEYWRHARDLGEQLKGAAQFAAGLDDPGGALILIRLQLIQEELAELAKGFIDGDVVECFDALVDLSYVVDGTYLSLGLGGAKVAGIEEVHRSNMSKLGEDGKPIVSSAGRIAKGSNYSPPNLAAVLGEK